MSNINRRDYLKGIAATAGVIAGSKLDAFAQGSRHSRGKRRNQIVATNEPKPANALAWKITDSEPSPDAFVTAIFDGLMGFGYDERSDIGEVAFYRSNHKLTVRVYNASSCQQIREPLVVLPSIKDLSLAIEPSSPTPVNYFQKGPFDRWDVGHANDFRWLPDLDGPLLYGDRLPRITGHYATKLSVKNATFYTLLRTASTFNLVTPDEQIVHPFGHVAKFMAAAIELAPGNTGATLRIGAQTIPLPAAGGVKYQVYFSNECTRSCPSDVNSSSEEKRNHFHLARKALDIPANRLKIGLKIKDPGSSAQPAWLCHPLVIAMHGKHLFATDEAPCMGAGYSNDRL